MKRTILLYAIALAVLIFLLKQLEYRYFIKDFSFEFYVGLIAILFTILGVWVGLKLTRRKKIIVNKASTDEFKVNENTIRELGISSREYEVLQFIAQGYSNQEIADRFVLSPLTVKRHISNIYAKLEAKNRTQAVSLARALKLIE